jgi:hypothetical protein
MGLVIEPSLKKSVCLNYKRISLVYPLLCLLYHYEFDKSLSIEYYLLFYFPITLVLSIVCGVFIKETSSVEIAETSIKPLGIFKLHPSIDLSEAKLYENFKNLKILHTSYVLSSERQNYRFMLPSPEVIDDLDKLLGDLDMIRNNINHLNGAALTFIDEIILLYKSYK